MYYQGIVKKVTSFSVLLASMAVTTGAIIVASAVMAFAGGYTITDLGTLGSNYSWATDINNRGQVVGYAMTNKILNGDSVYNAFLWDKGAMKDLGNLGGSKSIAYSINDKGNIVGKSLTYYSNQYSTTAFLWRNGNMTALPGKPSDMTSVAYGINNSNQIVGGPDLRIRYGFASIWENNTMTGLSVFDGSDSEARAINDAGKAVGKTRFSVGEKDWFEASLWSNGSLLRLGTLGGPNSYANSINETGKVVGYSQVGDSDYRNHAFLWENGQMVDLGIQGASNSVAYDINKLGQIVGTSYDGSVGTSQLNQHAVLWDKGSAINLNSFAAGTGWTLTEAVAMNDLGQIVGNGELNGVSRAFLLTPDSVTPTPIPGAALLLGSGLMGLVGLSKGLGKYRYTRYSARI